MDRIENSVHLGYLHRPTCTLFFLCFITFPSVVCFRCRKRPLYRRERGKVFGLNTLWQTWQCQKRHLRLPQILENQGDLLGREESLTAVVSCLCQ